MGLGETTWITCRDCGKLFGCGCVIQSACKECREQACIHDWREFEDGPAICRKCFGVRLPVAPGDVRLEA